jgi:hypothetical protein
MKISNLAYFLTYSFYRIPITYVTHDYIQIVKCSVSWRILEILETLFLNSYEGSTDFLPKNYIIVLVKGVAFFLVVPHYVLFSINS